LRHAITRELLRSVLDECPRVPDVVFFLAREVSTGLLEEEVDIERPVARLAAGQDEVESTPIEEPETVEWTPGVQVFWVRGRPSEATSAYRLTRRLAERGELLEPFERVLAGLREAYELDELDPADGN
jgi:hypothetical protein